jgi:hypothetical protein
MTPTLGEYERILDFSNNSCHNPILGYSPKFIFFQNKNQTNKIKAGNVEKASRGMKL